MKRRLTIIAMLMVLVLLLAACSCKHEWQAATCTAAKTCKLCSAVEGEALGHTWQNATCETAKTCSTCKTTEGEALGHDWQEATTEAPKTCSRCQQTEGERIITDSRFTTEATRHLQGIWTHELNFTAEMLGLSMGFANGVDFIMTMEFGNAGSMVVKIALKDEASFREDYREYSLESTYAALEAQGISREDADEAMLQAYGLNVADYTDAMLERVDVGTLFQAIFQSINFKGVYYVEDNQIYSALSWSSTLFDGSNYTLDNGILIIDDMTMEDGGEPMQWKNAA